MWTTLSKSVVTVGKRQDKTRGKGEIGNANAREIRSQEQEACGRGQGMERTNYFGKRGGTLPWLRKMGKRKERGSVRSKADK